MRIFVTFEGKKSRVLENVKHCIYLDVENMKTVYDFMTLLKRRFKLKEHYFLCLSLNDYFISDSENIKVLENNDCVNIRISKLNERINPYPELANKRFIPNDLETNSMEVDENVQLNFAKAADKTEISELGEQTMVPDMPKKIVESFQEAGTFQIAETSQRVEISQMDESSQGIELSAIPEIEEPQYEKPVRKTEQFKVKKPVASSTPLEFGAPNTFFLPRKFQLKPVAPRAKINMGSMTLSSKSLNSRKDRGLSVPHGKSDRLTKENSEATSEDKSDETRPRRMSTRSQTMSESSRVDESDLQAAVNKSHREERSKDKAAEKGANISIVKEQKQATVNETVQSERKNEKVSENALNPISSTFSSKETKPYPKFREVKKVHIKFTDDDDDNTGMAPGISEDSKLIKGDGNSTAMEVDYTPITQPVYVEPPLLLRPDASYEIPKGETKTVGASQSTSAQSTRTRMIDNVIDAYNKKMDAALGTDSSDDDESDVDSAIVSNPSLKKASLGSASQSSTSVVLQNRSSKVLAEQTSPKQYKASDSESALKNQANKKVADSKPREIPAEKNVTKGVFADLDKKGSYKIAKSAVLKPNPKPTYVRKPIAVKNAPGLNISSVVAQLNKELEAEKTVHADKQNKTSAQSRTEISSNEKQTVSQSETEGTATSEVAIESQQSQVQESSAEVSASMSESLEEMLRRSREYAASRCQQSNIESQSRTESSVIEPEVEAEQQPAISQTPIANECAKKRKVSESSDSSDDEISVSVCEKVQSGDVTTSNTDAKVTDTKRARLDISDEENRDDSSDSSDTTTDDEEEQQTSSTNQKEVREVVFSVSSSSCNSNVKAANEKLKGAQVTESLPCNETGSSSKSSETLSGYGSSASLKAINASISLPNGQHKVVTTCSGVVKSGGNGFGGACSSKATQPADQSSSDESTSEEEAEIRANIRKTTGPGPAR